VALDYFIDSEAYRRGRAYAEIAEFLEAGDVEGARKRLEELQQALTPEPERNELC
jgi:hypothetical protein